MPLQFMTIPQLLDRAVHAQRRQAGGDLCRRRAAAVLVRPARRADDVAAGLLALGIGRGDRVGIWAPNRAEWLYVQFGTARIGAILVNINPAYRTSELEYALNKVGCKALVMASRHKSSDYVGMLRALAPEIDRGDAPLRAAKLPSLKHVIVLDDQAVPRAAMSFASLMSLAGPAHRARLDALTRGARPRRRHQHPVHQRHHRRAEGRHAQPLQHRQQRPLRRANAWS